jgi:hypothetical protein
VTPAAARPPRDDGADPAGIRRTRALGGAVVNTLPTDQDLEAPRVSHNTPLPTPAPRTLTAAARAALLQAAQPPVAVVIGHTEWLTAAHECRCDGQCTVTCETCGPIQVENGAARAAAVAHAAGTGHDVQVCDASTTVTVRPAAQPRVVAR